jgi:hypothetical protein
MLFGILGDIARERINCDISDITREIKKITEQRISWHKILYSYASDHFGYHVLNT